MWTSILLSLRIEMAFRSSLPHPNEHQAFLSVHFHLRHYGSPYRSRSSLGSSNAYWAAYWCYATHLGDVTRQRDERYDGGS